LASTITAAKEQEHSQVAELAQQVQQVTGGTGEVAFADQGSTGIGAAEQAQRTKIAATSIAIL
jgi:TRAP-type C4-dicarboxylate transport system substrate-binding protein